MSQAAERRRELADFLRSRRQRVNPADVGFPVGPRRRTLGLRREEVAVLAGLSPTWYTYLEQGRKIRPSPEVLDSLAAALQLSEDERLYLHGLAYGDADPAEPALDAEGMAVINQLVACSGDGPYPLYAVDPIGAVLAWNKAAAEWYTDWAVRTRIERNMIWWIVTDPEARERVVDWADDACDIVRRMRVNAPRYLTDARYQSFIRRLRATSDDCERWWTQHDVRGQRLRTRKLHHPTIGVRAFLLTVVRPQDHPSVSLVFHLPATPDDVL